MDHGVEAPDTPNARSCHGDFPRSHVTSAAHAGPRLPVVGELYPSLTSHIPDSTSSNDMHRSTVYAGPLPPYNVHVCQGESLR